MALCLPNVTATRLSPRTVAFVFGWALLAAPPLAAQDCQPVFDAFDKVMATPAHIVSTTESGGKPKTTETIYFGDDIYTLEKDKWVRSPIKLAQVQKTDQENRRKSSYACNHLKDELIDGDVVAQYKTHSVILGTVTDSEIWISKASGLIVRNEVDITTTAVGGNKAGKSHYSVRYDYKDVKPPKV
ncbi:MAG TPA: hypothetical protein VGL72_12200 [Bryobacteraceae bacterium]|jgi:hypothetical protein